MSGAQPTPYPIEPEKSWLSRHLVLTIVLAVSLAVVAFIVALGAGVMSLMKSSDAYQYALAKAQQSPAVTEALGTPVKPAWWLTGSINVSGPSGNADLAVPISGPKGNGTVYVVAIKQAGEWHYKRLEVGIEGQGQRISLIPRPAGDQAEPREQ